MKPLAQGHIAMQWFNQGSNPSSQVLLLNNKNNDNRGFWLFSGVFNTLTSNLLTTLRARKHFYLHLPNEQIESERQFEWLKVTQHVSGQYN